MVEGGAGVVVGGVVNVEFRITAATCRTSGRRFLRGRRTGLKLVDERRARAIIVGTRRLNRNGGESAVLFDALVRGAVRREERLVAVARVVVGSALLLLGAGGAVVVVGVRRARSVVAGRGASVGVGVLGWRGGARRGVGGELTEDGTLGFELFVALLLLDVGDVVEACGDVELVSGLACVLHGDADEVDNFHVVALLGDELVGLLLEDGGVLVGQARAAAIEVAGRLELAIENGFDGGGAGLAVGDAIGVLEELI